MTPVVIKIGRSILSAVNGGELAVGDVGIIEPLLNESVL